MRTTMRRLLLVACVGLAGSRAAAQDFRASSYSSVTGNRGVAMQGNRGEAIDPSRINRGTPVQGNTGEPVDPSRVNRGAHVEGNRGESIGGYDTGDTWVDTSGSGYVEAADFEPGCCYGEGDGSSGALFFAAAPKAAPAEGTVVRSLPANCYPIDIDGIAYEECDGTYYAPSFSGLSTTYVVRAPPR